MRKTTFLVSLIALFVLLLASTPVLAGGKKAFEGVVNLNTATEAELELLPGIGAAKVRAIVVYRRSHPFRTVEEIVRVKGIGAKMLKKLRPHVTVSGPTT